MQDSGMLGDVHSSSHIDSRKEANAAVSKVLEPPSAYALLCTFVIRLTCTIVLRGECSVWMVLTWRNVSNNRPSPLLIEIGKFWHRCAADSLSDVWLANNVLIQSNPHNALLLDWASVRPMQKSVCLGCIQTE
jgi:hypothetical protein